MTTEGMAHRGRWPLAQLIFAFAAAILSFEPIGWLIETWFEPAYDSKGLYVFGVVVALFLWSLTSRPGAFEPPRRNLAFVLIFVTALVRMIGQIFAVNTIGALTLVVDVYALGLLAGLNRRARPLSSFWLAAAFAFSLPLERIAQRTIGYGLQNLSADGACLILRGFYDDVRCHGVRIVLAGQDVLVDLPCSGARTLLMLLLGFCLLASLTRPGLRQALVGGALAVFSGLVANMLRIAVLAAGIAEPARFHNIDVMGQPWHDLIGLAALALALSPLLVWSNYERLRREKSGDCRSQLSVERKSSQSPWLEPVGRTGLGQFAAAMSLLAAAVTIVHLPRSAMDVARRSVSVNLPHSLAGLHAQPIALLPRERSYFVKYGGAAQKSAYGPFQLLVVRTSVPLRHLHAPEECLRGMGMTVRYLGIDRSATPSAIYSVQTPDGDRYRIDVSFVSDTGQVTTNVSEAVWRWLQRPDSTWSAIQRISPAEIAEQYRRSFDRAVVAAFDLPHLSNTQ